MQLGDVYIGEVVRECDVRKEENDLPFSRITLKPSIVKNSGDAIVVGRRKMMFHVYANL